MVDSISYKYDIKCDFFLGCHIFIKTDQFKVELSASRDQIQVNDYNNKYIMNIYENLVSTFKTTINNEQQNLSFLEKFNVYYKYNNYIKLELCPIKHKINFIKNDENVIRDENLYFYTELLCKYYYITKYTCNSDGKIIKSNLNNYSFNYENCVFIISDNSNKLDIRHIKKVLSHCNNKNIIILSKKSYNIQYLISEDEDCNLLSNLFEIKNISEYLNKIPKKDNDNVIYYKLSTYSDKFEKISKKAFFNSKKKYICSLNQSNSIRSYKILNKFYFSKRFIDVYAVEQNHLQKTIDQFKLIDVLSFQQKIIEDNSVVNDYNKLFYFYKVADVIVNKISGYNSNNFLNYFNLLNNTNCNSILKLNFDKVYEEYKQFVFYKNFYSDTIYFNSPKPSLDVIDNANLYSKEYLKQLDILIENFELKYPMIKLVKYDADDLDQKNIITDYVSLINEKDVKNNVIS